MAVAANVLDLIGSTPLIDVSQLSPNPNVRILGKAEFLNPAGSVKAALPGVKGPVASPTRRAASAAWKATLRSRMLPAMRSCTMLVRIA